MNQKVLIIEDDELLREIYATKLAMEGFTVSTAADGVEGLQQAAVHKPTIILLDMIMPRMTGLDFLRAYQLKNHPGVSVVVMSNHSSSAEIAKAKALGVLDYLIKSQHTPDDIVRRIRVYLEEPSEKSTAVEP